VALAEHEFVIATDLLPYARPKCGNFTISFIFIVILTIMTAGIGVFAYSRIQEKRKRIESGMYEKKRKRSCVGNYFKDRLEYYLLLFSYIFGACIVMILNRDIWQVEHARMVPVIMICYGFLILLCFEKIFCCGADKEIVQELCTDLSDALIVQQHLNYFRIREINYVEHDIAITDFRVGDQITHFRQKVIKDNTHPTKRSNESCWSCYNTFSVCCQLRSVKKSYCCFRSRGDVAVVDAEMVTELAVSSPMPEHLSTRARFGTCICHNDYKSIDFHFPCNKRSDALSNEELRAEFIAVVQKAMKEIWINGENYDQSSFKFKTLPRCAHNMIPFIMKYQDKTIAKKYQWYAAGPICTNSRELTFVLDIPESFCSQETNFYELEAEIHRIWDFLPGKDDCGTRCGKLCVRSCRCNKMESYSSSSFWEPLEDMNQLDMWLPSATENRPIEIKIKRKRWNPYKGFFKLGFGYCGIATNEVDRITEIDAVKLPFMMFIAIFTSVFYYIVSDASHDLKTVKDFYLYIAAFFSTALILYRAARYTIQSVITVDKSVMENIVPYSGFWVQKIRTVTQDVRELTDNNSYSVNESCRPTLRRRLTRGQSRRRYTVASLA